MLVRIIAHPPIQRSARAFESQPGVVRVRCVTPRYAPIEGWRGEQGLSDTTLSCPTMLDAVVRLGVSWQRAKHWIVSPDPAYERKKTAGTA